MTPSNCFWNNSPLPGTEISVMALPPSYLSFYYFIILATTYWRKANFQTNSSHSQPKVLSLQFPEAGHERCVSPRTVSHFCCLKYTAHPNPWTPLTSNDHPKTGDNFSSHVFLSTAPACIGSPVFTNTTASLSEGSGPEWGYNHPEAPLFLSVSFSREWTWCSGLKVRKLLAFKPVPASIRFNVTSFLIWNMGR